MICRSIVLGMSCQPYPKAYPAGLSPTHAQAPDISAILEHKSSSSPVVISNIQYCR
jgi:hypothetical protein